MNSDYIVIERELLKFVLDENKRLKEELSKYKSRELEPQILDRQISMEEYIKELRLERNGNKMCNKKNKGENK